jgi:hypothetical protein
MHSPISRRSAIFRAFAAISAVDLFAYNAKGHRQCVDIDNPAAVVPGLRIGDIYLGMSEAETIGRYGIPEVRRVFEAEDLKRTAEIFAYINSQQGTEFKIDESYIPTPETTCLCFKSKGLSMTLVGDKISSIVAYTGVVAGFDKGDYAPNSPPLNLPNHISALKTLADIRNLLGSPAGENTMSSAPVPSISIGYREGIGFEGRLDDGRISHLSIFVPKERR